MVKGMLLSTVAKRRSGIENLKEKPDPLQAGAYCFALQNPAWDVFRETSHGQQIEARGKEATC